MLQGDTRLEGNDQPYRAIHQPPATATYTHPFPIYQPAAHHPHAAHRSDGHVYQPCDPRILTLRRAAAATPHHAHPLPTSTSGRPDGGIDSLFPYHTTPPPNKRSPHAPPRVLHLFRRSVTGTPATRATAPGGCSLAEGGIGLALTLTPAAPHAHHEGLQTTSGMLPPHPSPLPFVASAGPR